MRGREAQEEHHGDQGYTTTRIDSRDASTNTNADLPMEEGDDWPSELSKGWEHREDAAFPWRIKRLVQKEEDWRSVWVLEVKDMWSMDWKRVQEQRGSRWRLGTVPQAHRPLPYEREVNQVRRRKPAERDELSEWLERP